MHLFNKILALSQYKSGSNPRSDFRFEFPDGSILELCREDVMVLSSRSFVVNNLISEDGTGDTDAIAYFPVGTFGFLALIVGFFSENKTFLDLGNLSVDYQMVVDLVEFFHFVVDSVDDLLPFFKEVCDCNSSFQANESVILGLVKGYFFGSRDIDYKALIDHYGVLYYSNVSSSISSLLLSEVFSGNMDMAFFDRLNALEKTISSYYLKLLVLEKSDAYQKTEQHLSLLNDVLEYECRTLNGELRPAEYVFRKWSFQYVIAPSTDERDVVFSSQSSFPIHSDWKHLSMQYVETEFDKILDPIQRLEFLSDMSIYQTYHSVVKDRISTYLHTSCELDLVIQPGTRLGVLDLECPLIYRPLLTCLENLSAYSDNDTFMKSDGLGLVNPLIITSDVGVQELVSSIFLRLSSREENYEFMMTNMVEIFSNLQDSPSMVVQTNMIKSLMFLYGRKDNASLDAALKQSEISKLLGDMFKPEKAMRWASILMNCFNNISNEDLLGRLRNDWVSRSLRTTYDMTKPAQLSLQEHFAVYLDPKAITSDKLNQLLNQSLTFLSDDDKREHSFALAQFSLHDELDTVMWSKGVARFSELKSSFDTVVSNNIVFALDNLSQRIGDDPGRRLTILRLTPKNYSWM